ncbi:hypothetical protein [Acinetobacter lactucae]|uniref:hypothetical protein n=1 Tax=Acinetobacter lactucae TaxID=1785128 RepID=UPI0039F6E694
MKKNIFLEKKLLTLLFSASNKTLQAFTLNQRVGISQTDFLKLVFEMKDDGLLIIDGVFIKLSTLGEEKVLLDLNSSKSSKNNIPKKFLSESKLKVNELYIPKRSLL